MLTIAKELSKANSNLANATMPVGGSVLDTNTERSEYTEQTQLESQFLATEMNAALKLVLYSSAKWLLVCFAFLLRRCHYGKK